MTFLIQQKIGKMQQKLNRTYNMPVLLRHTLFHCFYGFFCYFACDLVTSCWPIFICWIAYTTSGQRAVNNLYAVSFYGFSMGFGKYSDSVAFVFHFHLIHVYLMFLYLYALLFCDIQALCFARDQLDISSLERATTCWPGIRIICPSRATYLLVFFPVSWHYKKSV